MINCKQWISTWSCVPACLLVTSQLILGPNLQQHQPTTLYSINPATSDSRNSWMIHGHTPLYIVTLASTSGLDSIINTVRARRLGLFSHVIRFSRDVTASNILAICCASRDGYPPDPFWRCSSEPGWITSLLTLACLWPIHFLWHKIVCSGEESLRPQRLRVPDWLIEN